MKSEPSPTDEEIYAAVERTFSGYDRATVHRIFMSHVDLAEVFRLQIEETTPLREFWKNMVLGLKDEMIKGGNRIEELEQELNDMRVPVPVDDIEYIIARYFFQVERGQNEHLDRINAWLDKIKPIEETKS